MNQTTVRTVDDFLLESAISITLEGILQSQLPRSMIYKFLCMSKNPEQKGALASFSTKDFDQIIQDLTIWLKDTLEIEMQIVEDVMYSSCSNDANLEAQNWAEEIAIIATVSHYYNFRAAALKTDKKQKIPYSLPAYVQVFPNGFYGTIPRFRRKLENKAQEVTEQINKALH